MEFCSSFHEVALAYLCGSDDELRRLVTQLRTEPPRVSDMEKAWLTSLLDDMSTRPRQT